MSSAPSFNELYTVGQNEMKVRSAAANQPITDFAEGSAADIDIAVSAAMGEELVQYSTDNARKLFFDTAQDDDLDALAWDRLRLLRQPEQAARVAVVFTRATAAAGAGTIPAGTILTTSPDSSGATVSFTLDADVGFGANSGSLSASGTATCTSAGSNGNVDMGALTTATPAPFDSSIAVSNPERAAGGNAKESDEAFLSRIHAARQYPGTVGGIQYGAQLVAGVRIATCVPQLVGGLESGVIDLYVGDENGNSNSLMIAAVQASLNSWRAQGVPVNVLGTIVDNIAIALTCIWDSGANTAANRSALRAAVIDSVNGMLKSGPIIYPSRVGAAAMSVGKGLGLLDVQVALSVSPAAPVSAPLTLASSHVGRTSAAYVTIQ